VDGMDTGNTATGTNLVAGANKSTSWLDVLNTGLETAGDIFGNKNTSPSQSGTYTPIPQAAPVQKSNTVWKVLGIVAILAVVTVVVIKVAKKPAAGK